MKKTANIILIACILFNLSVGVLYAYSVIKSKLIESWDWTSSQAGLPYTLGIIFLAIGVFIGGRIQDKIGPRWVLTCGGALAGLGLILSGLIGNNPTGIAICFGVITGTGMGLGYGCATPPALKWFHPSKKGLVSGLIVGGFGIAALYLAPLANTLLSNFGIEKTLIILGSVAILISVPIAQFIKNPPTGYVPLVPETLKANAAKSAPAVDFTLSDMIKTQRFYLLFFMFLVSSSVGLMIIGNMSKIAKDIGITDAGIVAGIVAFLAITNTFGRILGGVMADKIGAINALFVVFILQAINMVGFLFYGNLAMLAIGIILVGFNYGTLLSAFPAISVDQYGLKNYGANYGVLFLSWGLAGAAAPMMADYFYDLHGNFNTAYTICAVMMTVLVLVNYLLKRNLAMLKR
ncbi:MAG: OFA family MFS transporter [Bacteroidales bacterium]|jgi:MFS family permease|nr:OFA family MFS transporter [Bacteroidales bacterium]